MGLLKSLYRLLGCCWRSSADVDVEPDVLVHVSEVQRAPDSTLAKPHSKPHDQDCIPEVFTKKYGKVITHDVEAREAVCITSDVAVLADAAVAGDSCITGNLLIAGRVKAKGNICVTGDVIVLADAHVEGQVCVTGNVFVKGDLAVRGKLDVGGKLCVFGSKDIQPAV